MWPLLKLYLKKIESSLRREFFSAAFVGVLLTFAPVLTFYAIGFTWVRAVALHHRNTWQRLMIISVIALTTVTFSPIVAAILVNWASISVLVGSMFLMNVDISVERQFGKAFSPLRLIFNPRARLEALKPILEEHAIGVDRYVNILNELTAPGAETNPLYAKPLVGSEEEIAEFVFREQQAIAQLPAALQALHADVSTREFLPESGLNRETSLIKQKTAVYQTYRNQLTPAQQGHFDAYLDATLGLTHAICVITQASLLVESPHEFIILEKQYYTNEGWQVVPQQTCIFYNDPTEKDVLFSLAQYKREQQGWTITHPLHRDKLFRPTMYPNPANGESNETRYRRYNYRKLDAHHPMCLQVCEAIEAFNRSMQVEPTTVVVAATDNGVQPQLTVANRPKKARVKRGWDMTVPSGVTVRNIHTEAARKIGGTPNSAGSLEFSSESDEDDDRKYTV